MNNGRHQGRHHSHNDHTSPCQPDHQADKRIENVQIFHNAEKQNGKQKHYRDIRNFFDAVIKKRGNVSQGITRQQGTKQGNNRHGNNRAGFSCHQQNNNRYDDQQSNQCQHQMILIRK